MREVPASNISCHACAVQKNTMHDEIGITSHADAAAKGYETR
jgi:hypothetical protein